MRIAIVQLPMSWTADENTRSILAHLAEARTLGAEVAVFPACATLTGGIEVSRHPGVIQVTFLAPLAKLDAARLLPHVREQHGMGEVWSWPGTTGRLPSLDIPGRRRYCRLVRQHRGDL